MADDAVSYTDTVAEDDALIAAAKKDVQAFGRLYDKYYESIFRYTYRRTFNQALAEDLTADTFFDAFRHLHRYRWKRIPFSAWLYRIATNEICMHYRRQKHESEFDPPQFCGEDRAPVEDYTALHDAMLNLKPIYQTVITLRFFEEKTVPEISHITGRKAGTVKSQLHRGLEQLRRVLTQKGIISLE